MLTKRKATTVVAAKEAEEKLRHNQLNQAAVGYCEAMPISLLERVRNKRTELSYRYTHQMEKLNSIEEELVREFPEERIAAINQSLNELFY